MVVTRAPAVSAGRSSRRVPSGAKAWLVPVVETLTTLRPVSIARIRAKAACCRFSSVPRKSPLLDWSRYS